jgi:AcrR family transcriptional regulator
MRKVQKMTKKEIIEAAYKVWGRELYLSTSLSHVAHELKVCKPALYRHFINKHALLEAMTRYFFDDFTAFVQTGYEDALKKENIDERIFMLIRSITEYYARNVNIFIFSMTKLHDRELDSFVMAEELSIRGIDLEFFHRSIRREYNFEPLVMRLIFATLTFFMAGFHKKGETMIHPPSEKSILKIMCVIGKIIGKGLCYTNEEIDSLDYNELESRIAGTVSGIEDDPLLKAVAGAVAEAGPWEASMEQVARRSGLSKSSLYCHFKSRQDMLHQLFLTESLRIINFAKQGIKLSQVPQEQLYLGIFSIAEYLRSKPDILVTLDWLRNRRLDLGPPGDARYGKVRYSAVHKNEAHYSKRHKEPPIEFLQLFDEVEIKPLQNNESPFKGLFAGEGDNTVISPWILFLIVNTLMRRDQNQILGDVKNTDIRFLYRFITLGIGGFKIQ